jgi:hypothetical protein
MCELCHMQPKVFCRRARCEVGKSPAPSNKNLAGCRTSPSKGGRSALRTSPTSSHDGLAQPARRFPMILRRRCLRVRHRAARARIRKLSAVSPSDANESKKFLTHFWPGEWELGSFRYGRASHPGKRTALSGDRVIAAPDCRVAAAPARVSAATGKRMGIPRTGGARGLLRRRRSLVRGCASRSGTNGGIEPTTRPRWWRREASALR